MHYFKNDTLVNIYNILHVVGILCACHKFHISILIAFMLNYFPGSHSRTFNKMWEVYHHTPAQFTMDSTLETNC